MPSFRRRLETKVVEITDMTALEAYEESVCMHGLGYDVHFTMENGKLFLLGKRVVWQNTEAKK